MLKFPHLFEQTVCKLNNESLFKSREVARSWKYFINERNYPWLCIVNIPTILKHSNTYLHLTAETGQIDAFKRALSEGLDINIKNIFDIVVFFITEGCFECVNLTFLCCKMKICIAVLQNCWNVYKTKPWIIFFIDEIFP